MAPRRHALRCDWYPRAGGKALLGEGKFRSKRETDRLTCDTIHAIPAIPIRNPQMSTTLAYFDSYKRNRLAANLVQAQRDFFGSHTFERTDKPRGEMYHCKWTDEHA